MGRRIEHPENCPETCPACAEQEALETIMDSLECERPLWAGGTWVPCARCERCDPYLVPDDPPPVA